MPLRRTALLVVAIFFAAPLAGCIKNMDDLKETLGATDAPAAAVAPVARASATPTVAKVNDPITFSAAASTDPEGKGLTASWDFSDAGKSTGLSVVKRFATAGTRTVTLTVTTTRGATDSTTLEVEILPRNQAPIARLQATPVIQLAGETVKFDASASTDAEGGPLSFEWDFGDGTTAPSRSTPGAEHVYTKPGLYTARVTVRDPEGLLSSASRLVAINWSKTWTGEHVTISEPERMYTIPVPALASRVSANLSFDATLGLASAKFRLLDAAGTEVSNNTGTGELGRSGQGYARFNLTRESLAAYVPGDWTLYVTRESGFDITYALRVSVALD